AGLRAQLEPGTRKMVMLHVEVLKAGAQRGAALAAALTTALEHDGIADGLDEDGATLLFQGEDALVPAVRALFTALFAREALSVIQISLRAAAVFGKGQITEKDELLAGVLPSLRGEADVVLAGLLCKVCGVAKEHRITKLPEELEALKRWPTELEAALVVAGVRSVPQPFTPGQAVYALRSVLSVGAPG